MLTFQAIISRLSHFWASHGCLLEFPYDLEKGAGTSNPLTFLRALGPEPFSCAYVEPCRRPKDGRYGQNPNRLQHYFQYQVILKPSPDNIVDLYLESLSNLGLDTTKHDIRFVHDDWENPTLGASGLGWEVWIDGMEMTQFTYFQSVAGLPLSPVTGEITYGIERIAMCLQGVESIFDLQWNSSLTYGDLYKQQEIEWSRYNFELQDEHMWMRHFEDFRKEASRLLAIQAPIPAYDFILKSSHAFNMLDAKGVISVSERASYIAAIRELSKKVGEAYVTQRESLGFPLCKKQPHKQTKDSIQTIAPTSSLLPAARLVMEIGIEELPATFVPIGIAQLEAKAKALFQKEKLQYKSLKTVGTPRRLALIVEDLQAVIPEKIEEKRGPSLSKIWTSDHSLTTIGEGFLQSLGLDPNISESDIRQNKIPGIDIRSFKGEEYLYSTTRTPERQTSDLLEKALPSCIEGLEFPKMMHWGEYDLSFARPIRWILSLFDGRFIPFSVGPIMSSNTTRGHRLLHPEPFVLENARAYESELEQRKVIVDQKKRKEMIEKELRLIESEHKAECLQFQKVLSEILYLVEYPHVHAILFDSSLLDAPKAVVVSEMVEHQKYFPLQSLQTGSLLPYFVVTAHIPYNSDVEKGNLKVLSARLKDGRFLWQEDCALGLHALQEKLSAITYQKSLGSIEQKCARISMLASFLAPRLQANSTCVEMAARLCKADLASNVVGEFPELQGVVGGLLARQENLDPAVEIAMKEHWLPIQDKGALPSTPEAIALSLADKIDTLTGFFALGLIPSSSHDPYALRRQALGVVRILIEKKISLSLFALLEESKRALSIMFGKDIQTYPLLDILRFIMQRAKIYCMERFPKDLCDAVFATDIDDIYAAEKKLSALTALQADSQGTQFVEVLKRVLGQIEGNPKTAVDPALFQDDCEKDLWTSIQKAQEVAKTTQKTLEWSRFVTSILALQSPLNTFFSTVHVLHDNPKVRANRIGLLWEIFELVQNLADPKTLICIKH